MFRFLIVLLLMGAPITARAVTCDATQYANGDVCTECPANATCDGTTYTCADGFNDNGGICATCPAGRYLVNNACKACPKYAYCPGDDTAKQCVDLWSGGLSGFTATNDHAYVTDATSPDGCVCGFTEVLSGELANQVHAKYRYYLGKCTEGPTEYIGVRYDFCHSGYYGRIQDEQKRWNLYEECAPCNNRPSANSKYTGRGTPDPDGSLEKSICPWTCNSGYYMYFTETTDGTEQATDENAICRQSCMHGFSKLNIESGENRLSIHLFNDRRTDVSLNIGPSVDKMCYADLQLESELMAGLNGPVVGLKINRDGTIYSTISKYRQMDCSAAGYYLNAGGACSECGGGHFCPDGQDVRHSCAETIVDQTDQGIPLPSVYNRTDFYRLSTPSQCWCIWYSLSAPGMTRYNIRNACELGLQDVQNNRFLYYEWCDVGYYAVGPRGSGNWYRGCSPCTNGPANSHYTSYSTPSVMYAVESNCPWECDDGYVRDGDICVAE